MPRASGRQTPSENRNDPGVSNDPVSEAGKFDAHIWTSLNQVFERLGKIDEKLTSIATDQKDLKNSVDKHERIVARVGYTVAGAIAVISALWFIYDQFLKDRVFLK